MNQDTNAMIIIFRTLTYIEKEPRYRSRYGDWLRTGWSRGRSPCRVNNFYFSISSRPALGSIQPPSQWITRAISSGVKRPGREDDNSPPSRAEVKKTWFYASYTSLIQLQGVVLNELSKGVILLFPLLLWGCLRTGCWGGFWIEEKLGDRRMEKTA
jgi:hypothetical protein